MEELPPNELFFDKKRKAVVKREFYQEAGSTAKKFKVLTDGKYMKSDTVQGVEWAAHHAAVRCRCSSRSRNRFIMATVSDFPYSVTGR